MRVSGVRCQFSGLRYLLLYLRILTPETRHLKPKILNKNMRMNESFVGVILIIPEEC
jgi:hypothetical protein